MKNFIFIAALLCAACRTQAQTVNDEQELQAFVRQFMTAYNTQDHAALGKMYTDDAVRIDQTGREIKGAGNIAAYFAEEFRYNNTTLIIRQRSIHWSDAEHAFITKGDYEVYGKTYVYDIAINFPSHYTNVMQKKDGVWKIVKSSLGLPNVEAIKPEIKAIEDAWAAAFNANDAATILEFYANDAVSMADDRPMAVGKAAIQKIVEAELATKKQGTTVSFEMLDLFGNENMVTEVGKTTVKDAAGKVIYTGKYMALWEKRGGKWLTIRDMTNDDKKD